MLQVLISDKYVILKHATDFSKFNINNILLNRMRLFKNFFKFINAILAAAYNNNF